MIKRPRILGSAGDTIVEVMIVLAVLGLAFSISYATATRGLAQSRNAEEHSQALGILSSQVELVRAQIDQGGDVFRANPYCLTGSTQTPTNLGYAAVPSSVESDDWSKYTGCTSGLYHESVTYDSSTGLFDLKVRWDGNGGLKRQQVELTYRVYSLSPTSNAGVPLSNSAPQVRAQVFKIPPRDAGGGKIAPPACSDSGRVALPNATVKLNQTGETHITDNTGSFTFTTGISQDATYTVTVTPPAAGSPPAGYSSATTAPPGSYAVCAPNSTSPPSATSATPTNTNASPSIPTIYLPGCWQVTITDPDTGGDPIYGPDVPVYVTDPDTGGNPIYGSVYYVPGAQRPDRSGRYYNPHLTDQTYTHWLNPFVSGEYLYLDKAAASKDLKQPDSSGGYYYNAWNSVATQDIIGYTPIVHHSHIDHYVQGPIIGYTPIVHHSHLEWRCTP